MAAVPAALEPNTCAALRRKSFSGTASGAGAPETNRMTPDCEPLSGTAYGAATDSEATRRAISGGNVPAGTVRDAADTIDLQGRGGQERPRQTAGPDEKGWTRGRSTLRACGTPNQRPIRSGVLRYSACGSLVNN